MGRALESAVYHVFGPGLAVSPRKMGEAVKDWSTKPAHEKSEDLATVGIIGAFLSGACFVAAALLRGR